MVPVPEAVVPFIVKVMVAFAADAVYVEHAVTTKLFVVVLIVIATLLVPAVQVGATPEVVETAVTVRALPSLKVKSEVCQLPIAFNVKSASTKSTVNVSPAATVSPPTSVQASVWVAVVERAWVDMVSLKEVTVEASTFGKYNANMPNILTTLTNFLTNLFLIIIYF
jgi:hypothetical protein